MLNFFLHYPTPPYTTFELLLTAPLQQATLVSSHFMID